MTAPLDLRPPSKPVNLYTGQDCTFRVVGLPAGTYTARQVTGADQTPVGDPLSCTADGADWLVALPASRRLPHSRIQVSDATEVVLELAPTWLARGVPGPATRTVTVTSGASPTLEIVVQDGPSIAVERARAEDAEVALGVRVDGEALARQDEDAVLAAAITSEATSRANADTAEVTNRNAAIAVHAAAIDPHGDRAYTDSRIAAILGGVPPAALDTVIELANQMLADEGVVVTLTTLVGTKETPAGAQAKADSAQAAAITAAAALVDDGSGVTNPAAFRTAIGAQAAGTYLTPANIVDDAYDATSWDGDTTHAPSKNAVRDKIEALAAAKVTRLNEGLLAWAYSSAFRLVSATRDTNEAITIASVVWPDGATGTFTTDTASTLFPGAIDAYHVTYVPASGPTLTITQAAVTRDTAGGVTAQPALAVA